MASLYLFFFSRFVSFNTLIRLAYPEDCLKLNTIAFVVFTFFSFVLLTVFFYLVVVAVIIIVASIPFLFIFLSFIRVSHPINWIPLIYFSLKAYERIVCMHIFFSCCWRNDAHSFSPFLFLSSHFCSWGVASVCVNIMMSHFCRKRDKMYDGKCAFVCKMQFIHFSLCLFKLNKSVSFLSSCVASISISCVCSLP